MVRRFFYVAALVLFVATAVASLRLQPKTSVRPAVKPVPALLPHGAGLAASVAAPLLFAPTVALADGGGVGMVAVPLLISVFVMVPFLWYQQ